MTLCPPVLAPSRAGSCLLRRTSGEMGLKPTRGMADHCLQRSWLWKKMARPGNNHQSLRAAQPGQCLLIELDDHAIGATDDQQRLRPNRREGTTGESGPPAA